MNYLYNGVLLPALPEWDKETYPYAVIMATNFSTVKAFYISDKPAFMSYDEDLLCVIYPYGTNYMQCSSRSGAEWGEFGDANTPTSLVIDEGSRLIWTNHDILNEDGSIYLAASEPIPVNPPDALSIILGNSLGCRLRSMKLGPTPIIPTTLEIALTDKLDINVCFRAYTEQPVVIDFGDGTVVSQMPTGFVDINNFWFGSNGNWSGTLQHIYVEPGNYKITITETTESGYILGINDSGYPIIRYSDTYIYSPLTHASIGSGVKIIDRYAFRGCSNLLTCDISCSTVKIDDSTFGGCKQLDLTLPRSIKEIGDSAFYGCQGLSENLTIFSETVHGHAYFACTQLRKVWIRDSVKTLGDVIEDHTWGGSPFRDCDPSLVLYCEADEKPDGWVDSFNQIANVSMYDPVYLQVVWGQKTRPW
jgi:hypothetical protein